MVKTLKWLRVLPFLLEGHFKRLIYLVTIKDARPDILIWPGFYVNDRVIISAQSDWQISLKCENQSS